MYEMLYKPNFMHSVSIVGRFLLDIGNAHREALKWVLRYVNGIAGGINTP